MTTETLPGLTIGAPDPVDVYLDACEIEHEARLAYLKATAHREACEVRARLVLGPAAEQVAAVGDAEIRAALLSFMRPQVAAALRRLADSPAPEQVLEPEREPAPAVDLEPDPPTEEQPTRTVTSYPNGTRPSRPRAGSTTGEMEFWYRGASYSTYARHHHLGNLMEYTTPAGKKRWGVWLTEPERATVAKNCNA